MVLEYIFCKYRYRYWGILGVRVYKVYWVEWFFFLVDSGVIIIIEGIEGEYVRMFEKGIFVVI